MAQFNLQRTIVRHQYLTKAFFIFAGSFLMLTLATIPFFKSASELSSKIKTRSAEEQELTNKVTVLTSLDQSILDERVQVLDQALPPRKDVVLYLTTINGLSNELGLNFGGISLAPGEVTEASLSAAKTKQQLVSNGLQSLETDIKIEGPQDSIYSFLKLIEQSAPLMQIKDVKVSSQEDGGFSLGLRLGMLWALADINQVKGQIALFDDKEEKYFQQLDEFRRFTPLTGSVFEPQDEPALPKTNLFKKPAEAVFKPQP